MKRSRELRFEEDEEDGDRPIKVDVQGPIKEMKERIGSAVFRRIGSSGSMHRLPRFGHMDFHDEHLFHMLMKFQMSDMKKKTSWLVLPESNPARVALALLTTVMLVYVGTIFLYRLCFVEFHIIVNESARCSRGVLLPGLCEVQERLQAPHLRACPRLGGAEGRPEGLAASPAAPGGARPAGAAADEVRLPGPRGGARTGVRGLRLRSHGAAGREAASRAALPGLPRRRRGAPGRGLLRGLWRERARRVPGAAPGRRRGLGTKVPGLPRPLAGRRGRGCARRGAGPAAAEARREPCGAVGAARAAGDNRGVVSVNASVDRPQRGIGWARVELQRSGIDRCPKSDACFLRKFSK
mmetsp:Transcript_98982/g.317433  ORF Transcript_98982/g.317433 Transcript_98982/m.317433 type:complete len:353 (-) Transcript_98982:82-1140(-)